MCATVGLRGVVERCEAFLSPIRREIQHFLVRQFPNDIAIFIDEHRRRWFSATDPEFTPGRTMGARVLRRIKEKPADRDDSFPQFSSGASTSFGFRNR